MPNAHNNWKTVYERLARPSLSSRATEYIPVRHPIACPPCIASNMNLPTCLSVCNIISYLRLIRKEFLIMFGGMVNLEQLIRVPPKLLLEIDIPSPKEGPELVVAAPAGDPAKFRRNMPRFRRRFHFPCRQKISTALRS